MLRSIIKDINFELGKLQEKTQTISNDSIQHILDSEKLSNPQKILINEIINTSKREQKQNRKYSEDWILLCVLLKIRQVYIM